MAAINPDLNQDNNPNLVQDDRTGFVCLLMKPDPNLVWQLGKDEKQSYLKAIEEVNEKIREQDLQLAGQNPPVDLEKVTFQWERTESLLPPPDSPGTLARKLQRLSKGREYNKTGLLGGQVNKDFTTG